MRIFISSKISSNYIQSVSSLYSFLKSSNPSTFNKLRFVDSKNIHLTYAFLGEVVDEKMVEILSKSFNIFASFKKIEFFSRDIGFFPNIERPKVLWADVNKKAADTTICIYKEIKNILNKNNIYTIENFTPHITLGRVKSILFKDEISLISGFKFDNASGFFENISIMNSTLTPKAPKYETLFEVKFG